MENFKCEGPNCKRPDRKITWGEYKYSMSVFRKALCINCQEKLRNKIYPKKLSKFLSERLNAKRNLST